MLPGPPQTIYCPHCETILSYDSLTSGNTFGATLWSDGKQVAPMMPLPPEIAKCPSCAGCFWLESASPCDDCDAPDNWTDPVTRGGIPVPAILEPDEQDYYDAFFLDLFEGKEQETRARVLAWWRCNDAQRVPFAPPVDWKARKTELWRDNLLRLEHLLDRETDQNHLMKAEIFRHQGYYDSAASCLRRVKSMALQDIVRKMQQWCSDQDTQIHELL